MPANLPVVFHYWIVPNSRGFSVVIVEQATESLPPDQWAICSVILRTTAATLLRSALKVLESAEYPTIQFRHITGCE